MNQSRQDKQPPEPKPHRSLGKKVTYAFSVTILLVIAVTFIGTPALSGTSGSSRPVFGTYDGEEIMISPGNYFSRTYQNVASYYQQVGVEITDQVYYSVWQTAYFETVFHLALLAEARRSGVAVSEVAADKAMASWPEFQVDGRFSLTEFQSMSPANRLVLKDYLTEVLIASQVRSDIASSAEFSEDEIDFITGMASPQKRFRFVEFGFDSFPDSEVVAYGEENSNRFRQVSLSQITIDSGRADAQSIRQQAVDRTSSFEDLARNQSSDEFADNGGERGWVYYWDLEFDFEDVAQVDELFSLAEGEISPVYETGGRFRFYRVDEAPLDPDFTNAETLAEVRNYVTSFERGIIEDYLRVEADAFTADARENGFVLAGIAINQVPQVTGYFPVNYGNSPYFPPVTAESNSVLRNSAAFREEFLQELFALELGEVSEPIVVRDYVMVFDLEDVLELTDERREELIASLPGQLQQTVTQEINQATVDEDLFVDNFNETYSRFVLGQ